MAAYKNKEDASILEALVRGATNGLTFGLKDEAAGLGAKLGEWWGRPTDNSAAQREALVKRYGEEFVKKIEAQEPKKKTEPTAYEQARDDYRREEQRVKDAHPLAYGAADLATSALVPIPGLGAAGSAAKKTVGTAIAKELVPRGSAEATKLLVKELAKETAKRGAVAGGLQGFGRSTSDTAGGTLLDTLTGAGVGAASGYGLSRLGSRLAPPGRTTDMDPQTMMEALAEYSSKGLKIPSELARQAESLGIKTATETSPSMLRDELLSRLTTGGLGALGGSSDGVTGAVMGGIAGTVAKPVAKALAPAVGAVLSNPAVPEAISKAVSGPGLDIAKEVSDADAPERKRLEETKPGKETTLELDDFLK